jgi:hypothetical protein
MRNEGSSISKSDALKRKESNEEEQETEEVTVVTDLI